MSYPSALYGEELSLRSVYRFYTLFVKTLAYGFYVTVAAYFSNPLTGDGIARVVCEERATCKAGNQGFSYGCFLTRLARLLENY